LSAQAAEKLKNRYVLMRNSAADREKETGKRTTIPITVRYYILLSCSHQHHLQADLIDLAVFLENIYNVLLKKLCAENLVYVISLHYS